MQHAEALERRTFLSGDSCENAKSPQTPETLELRSVSTQYAYPIGGDNNGRAANNNATSRGASAQKFTARLRGSSEIPARSTPSRGTATFTLSPNGLKLSFKINVSSLSNPVAAHLHFGKSSVNGPVVAQLLGPLSSGGGVRNGLLIQGTLRASNLTGSLAGKTIQNLVKAFKRGNIYVNVHTDDGSGGFDTGPGDFSSGELRGQVAVIPR